MRVHSAIVTLASPVFKIMLGPTFQEGRTLRIRSHVEIALPDDDPKLMAILFRSMHITYNKGEGIHPTSSLMVDFAQICDKYDCARSMWMICQTALSRVAFSHESGNFDTDPAGVGDALVAAVVMGVGDMIEQFATTMLRCFKTKNECSPKGNELASIYNRDIFGKSSPFQTLSISPKPCTQKASVFGARAVSGIHAAEILLEPNECPGNVY